MREGVNRGFRAIAAIVEIDAVGDGFGGSDVFSAGDGVSALVEIDAVEVDTVGDGFGGSDGVFSARNGIVGFGDEVEVTVRARRRKSEA